jgi:hypothetical protein
MNLIGKKLVGFSLDGVPSATRQIIKNANLETNFWETRNMKREKIEKIIRIMTDIGVKSEPFDIFFSGNFQEWLFQKAPDFGVTEKFRKWAIFRKNTEN